MGAKGFRHAGHPPSLGAALLHFDVSLMVWVLLGALGAYVAADLDLGSTEKGLMVAVPPLGGAAFRLVVGALADRLGIKRTGLATLGLTVVPLAWGALAGNSFAQVLGIGVLLGAAGASFAGALPLVGYWHPPEHRGLALGIAGAGNSGTLVAALAAPRIAEHVGFILPFALGSLEELTGSFAVGFVFMASAATAAALAVARRDRAWRCDPVQLEVAVA